MFYHIYIYEHYRDVYMLSRAHKVTNQKGLWPEGYKNQIIPAIVILAFIYICINLIFLFWIKSLIQRYEYLFKLLFAVKKPWDFLRSCTIIWYYGIICNLFEEINLKSIFMYFGIYVKESVNENYNLRIILILTPLTINFYCINCQIFKS